MLLIVIYVMMDILWMIKLKNVLLNKKLKLNPLNLLLLILLNLLNPLTLMFLLMMNLMFLLFLLLKPMLVLITGVGNIKELPDV